MPLSRAISHLTSVWRLRARQQFGRRQSVMLDENALAERGNTFEVAPGDRARRPLPEELPDPVSRNPITLRDLPAGPAVHEIKQHDSPLNIGAMQMRENGDL